MKQLTWFDGSEEFKINKPIRLIELFAGYGSQSLAMRYMGIPYESWRISEWAVNSILAYKDLHHPNDNTDYSEGMTDAEVKEQLRGKISIDYSNPIADKQLERMSGKRAREIWNSAVASHNLLSITGVHGEDLCIDEDHCYIMTYSFPCVPKGTLIRTYDWYKPIEEIKVGDYVRTHKARPCKVLKTMNRVADHINTIKAVGVPELKVTDEHPLYVLRDGELQWVRAKDLRMTDMLTMNYGWHPIDKNLDEKELWLIGRYVADGYLNKFSPNSVHFAIGNKKVEEFEKNVPEWFMEKVTKFQKIGCMDYRIADDRLRKICEEFGTGAMNKKLPSWVFGMDLWQQQSFFAGYIAGDGHIRKRINRDQVMWSTVSHELALGMQQLVIDMYGFVPSMTIRRDRRKPTHHDVYNLQYTCGRHLFQESAYDGSMLKPAVKIKSITRTEQPIEVYNIEVEDDNSYIAENVIVHNCQDLSIAGEQAGMKRESGTRSGLLWEVERILNECKVKPQVLLMENVPNLLSEAHRGDFGEWVRTLDAMGYVSEWEVLNSADFGIPQNRQRVFMVSVHGDYFYEFPQKTGRKYKLLDFCDDKADEKYYIKKSNVEYVEKGKTSESGIEILNAEVDGTSRTIKAHIGQTSMANFVRSDSFGATGVREWCSQNVNVERERGQQGGAKRR